jgi:multiple sugar transport system permease protein
MSINASSQSLASTAKTRAWLRERWLRWGTNRFLDFLLFLMLVFALFPIFWMVNTSLKTNTEILNNKVWPSAPRTQNYVDLWDKVNFDESFMTSLRVCTTATVLATAVSTLAGYALARFRFPGSTLFGLAVVATQLIPGIMLMLPLFLTFTWIKNEAGLKIIGTWEGLTFLYTGFFTPLSLWIIRGFFAAIPPDLEEAAMIDGASRFGAFWRVALPLARPGIVATSIYVFLTSWDELFFAWVMQVQTIPYGIRLFIGQFNNRFDLMMAAGVAVSIPVMIAFFLLQKHMVSGLTAGAVKG